MAIRAPLDAIVLTGGRARRLGGASKADVQVGGQTLLERVLDATRLAGARELVVVGPSAPPGVRSTREDPPFGGPVAGIAAGLAALGTASADLVPGRTGQSDGVTPNYTARSDVTAPGMAADAPVDDGAVLLLACDLPFVAAAVEPLLEAYRALDANQDGVCLLDPGGRMQWLAGVYRRRGLRDALARLEATHGAPVGRLMEPLRLVGVPSDAGADVDTWAAVEAARAAVEERY